MSTHAKLKPDQLVLELPHRQALGAEDFLVSQSNAAAVALIDAWPAWDHPALLAVGPQGSGKSHLAQVWRSRSGAAPIAAAALDEAALAALEAERAIVVEDIDRGITSERMLFHILNLAREERYSVLLTSRTAPGEFTVGLPDLRSRLRALPLVTLGPPDEALLKALLVKLFADRQLAVEPHVVSYLALHMGRSMEEASRVVAAVDRLSLARHRKVTRAIAADALAEAAGQGELGNGQ
jgi:chromosomal replication initiation ATPase DnaA